MEGLQPLSLGPSSQTLGPLPNCWAVTIATYVNTNLYLYSIQTLQIINSIFMIHYSIKWH